MSESLGSRLRRWAFNLFPAYWCTGARITYLADDFREIRVRLPLSWRTRNYVGTIFGGSMYAAVDPMYMMMLIQNLGADYEVWDKSASIRFRKPGRGTLRARFLLPEEEIVDIRRTLEEEPTTDRRYTVDLVGEEGEVHATVEKVVHVRKSEESG
ncbi:MAG: DUF4442 domain-containing protein [Candidatus Palauibacterales bacterium]|nr:DUF4442 domain-containing protein [Candidatus Palauibacterales bacterium]